MSTSREAEKTTLDLSPRVLVLAVQRVIIIMIKSCTYDLQMLSYCLMLELYRVPGITPQCLPVWAGQFTDSTSTAGQGSYD